MKQDKNEPKHVDKIMIIDNLHLMVLSNIYKGLLFMHLTK